MENQIDDVNTKLKDCNTRRKARALSIEVQASSNLKRSMKISKTDTFGKTDFAMNLKRKSVIMCGSD